MKSKKVWTGALSSQSKRNLLILETIRRRGEVSLGLISQQTGLNIPTISNHLNNLSREKIIVEKGAVFTGGRPATLIELNPKVAYILGIGINLKSVVVVLINFKGEILERAKEKIEKEDIQEILKTAIRLGKKIVKKARLNEEDIQGVGVGVAGIVDYDNGLIHWPSKVGPTYVSIYLSVEEIVRKEFAPSVVVIENDATVAAFAEWWLYLPEIKNAIYIYSGVGCGIIINGELYRGASGSAGEISIYNPQSKETAFAAEGEHPFYRWDLNLGIMARAKQAIEKGKETEIFKLADKKVQNIDLDIIIQAAEKGDELAKELIRKTGISLGVRLAYLINLLDPELVIIGGGMEKAGSFILAPIKETVKKWAFNHSLKKVKIVPAQIGEEVVAIGAANLVTRQMFTSV